MSGNAGDSNDQDSLALKDQIDQICDQFESAIKRGQEVRIEDLLQKIPIEGRTRLFCELVGIEVALTGAIGLAAYYDRFPSDHGISDGLSCAREPIRTSLESEVTPVPDELTTETVIANQVQRRQILHFQLRSLAGEGGFGQVWRAFDTNLKREVAIKIPHPNLPSSINTDLFLREAQTVARLRHENVVSVYQVGKQQGTIPWFIVSEFIDGSNLKDWLKKNAISAKSAVGLVLKIARALSHAHERGIVHRDIKPANILMNASNEPLLTDFGLAKLEETSDFFGAPGRLVGTIPYLSPEQASGDSDLIDYRTDIYALGTVFYELLTGDTPFHGTRDEVLQQISSKTPSGPRKLNRRVPVELEKVCLKCLEKDRSARYQTAGDLVQDLHHFLIHRPLSGITSPWYTPVTKWVTRNHRAVFSIFITILTCCGLGAALWKWNHPVPPVQLVEFETVPSGCEITVVKLDERTGDPDPDQIQNAQGLTPLQMRLSPGDYLVVAVQDSQHFHEVMRHVPSKSEQTTLAGYRYYRLDEDNCVRYGNPITIPRTTEGVAMNLIAGRDNWVCPLDPSISSLKSTEFRIPNLYVDLRETKANRNVARPRTGLLSSRFSDAMIYAEEMGKRLPTNLELLYLSDIVSSHPNQPNINLLPDGKEIEGLCTRPWEWTSTKGNDSFSPADQLGMHTQRIVRCGAAPLSRQPRPEGENHTFYPFELLTEFKGNLDTCVRCVRSPQPRRRPEDFIRQIKSIH